jgi:uncharacterized protein involved in outer membrane biogenesis
MGLFARIVGMLLAGVIVLLIVAAYWIQDANNLKPELEALVAKNSDYRARFNGNISWQLFPPLKLRVQDLELTREDERISVSDMHLTMDLSAMWEDINQWQVTQLKVADTKRTQAETQTLIEALTLREFRPGQPAAFTLTAEHLSGPDSAPLAAVLEGMITFYPATANAAQRIVLSDTQIDTAMASGLCQADITEVDHPPLPATPPREEDLLPVDVLLAYNLSADCRLSALTIGNETFEQATLNVTNTAGRTNALLDVQDFLGGTLVTDIDIDASANPIAWTIVPDMKNVDSQRLLAWTDQRMQWVAPLAFNSTIRMSGNSEKELAQSIKATSEFDGGQGQLNIATIKQQLMRVALLLQQADEVSQWPDVWNYQEFTGRWNINGSAQDLKFAIDNMSVDANGKYDYLADSMDMLLNVTVHEPPEDSPFNVNPLLQGTPIPVRCKGSSTEPDCRLEEAAVKKLVARALTQGDESGLRRKLEQKIDEEVPEEYRDTARSLLDILGRALDKE